MSSNRRKIARLIGSDSRMGLLQSPDWSKGLFIEENGTHDISKAIGGQAAFFLLTCGAGSALEGMGAASECGTFANVAARSMSWGNNILTGMQAATNIFDSISDFREGNIQGGLMNLGFGLFGAAMTVHGVKSTMEMKACFIAGTQVVVSTVEDAGSVDLDAPLSSSNELSENSQGGTATLAPRKTTYLTRSIESLHPGDVILAKDESNPNALPVPLAVEELFTNTAFQLTLVTIRSSTGNEQTIHSTNEHPVFVPGRGWVKCRELRPGDTLIEPSGNLSTVVSTRRELHPNGILVYNLRVRAAHTYFVCAESTAAEPVWVHNAYQTDSVAGEDWEPNPELEELDGPVTKQSVREALEQGIIKEGVPGINDPALRESQEFGTAVHQNFEKALIEQNPTTIEGDWEMKTAPGETGVDGTYVGPPERNPGFDYAELKPNSASGRARFGEQMDSWNLPKGRTQLWLYDKNGIIGFSGKVF